LGEYQFSADEPTTRADGTALQTGDVWFYNVTSSNVRFNVLKKHNIEVNPLFACQYINGAWENKNAEAYIDGSWEAMTSYLYNKGNEYTHATSGWTLSGHGSKGSTSITIGSTTSTYPVDGTLTSNGYINLKNLSTLTLTFSKVYTDSGYGNMAVFLINSAGANVGVYSIFYGDINSALTTTHDVTSVNEKCKIQIKAEYNQSSSKTKQVYGILTEVKVH